jgi:hypothetical protein
MSNRTILLFFVLVSFAVAAPAADRRDVGQSPAAQKLWKKARAKKAAEAEISRRALMSPRQLFNEFLKGRYAFEDGKMYKDFWRMDGTIIQIVDSNSVLVTIGSKMDVCLIFNLASTQDIHEGLEATFYGTVSLNTHPCCSPRKRFPGTVLSTS